MREGQPASGWFAKNAQQVSPTYWFYHDQFAAFTAHARNEGRQLLTDETSYLFGPGQFQGTAFGQTTYQWRGQRVLIEVTNSLNETTLSISSRSLQAQQAAGKQVKQQAEKPPVPPSPRPTMPRLLSSVWRPTQQTAAWCSRYNGAKNNVKKF